MCNITKMRRLSQVGALRAMNALVKKTLNASNSKNMKNNHSYNKSLNISFSLTSMKSLG